MDNDKIQLRQAVKIMQEGKICKNLTNGATYKIENNKLFRFYPNWLGESKWYECDECVSVLLCAEWKAVNNG